MTALIKTKRLCFSLILLLIYLPVLASNQSEPVSLASYEQRWLDSHATIALRNNTQDMIHNITFQLEYLDMNGNSLDYEIFNKKIEIAPGMTRKIDVPAYEHSRSYHYYKTPEALNHPLFKIKYHLNDYNTHSSSLQPENQDGTSTSSFQRRSYGSGLMLLVICLIFLGVYVGIYVLVAVMAQRRNRNPVIWLLLSFIGTPILMCLILLVIGKNYSDEY